MRRLHANGGTGDPTSPAIEAQRKSHQCTFRGVMARGRAMLEEEEEEEEDAQGGDGKKT